MSILPPPSLTRLVTIVAHVDHGKTTLADSLVEHNGIISERLAGSLRFLDSLEEEQRRGITIRSSAIALKHTYRPMKIKAKSTRVGNSNKSNNNDGKQEMVIHLIDSPGHVDFSMEVSSALQICDGALLLVDVVEGMCARTHNLLRESYAQKLVPILVLNKIDRLCTDLGLNVNEAYLRIRSVIESVNAAASAMIRNDRAKDIQNITEDDDQTSRTAATTTSTSHDRSTTRTKQKEEENDEDDEIVDIWTFDPSKGNVVFTSAIYGWGFTVPSLARSLFKSKLVNIKPPIMRQYLFGDFKYDSSSGKVLKWKRKSADDDSNITMFAEYGLKPLFQCFNGVSAAATSVGIPSVFFTGNHYQIQQHNNNNKINNHDSKDKSSQTNSNTQNNDVKIKATTAGMYDIIFPALQIGITHHDEIQQSLHLPKTLNALQQLLNKTNASSEELILRALLRRHRPLSEAVLDSVCEICPSPYEASSDIRIDQLSLVQYNGSYRDEFDDIQKAITNCSTSIESPTVAHCSKFVSTSRANINDLELFSFLDSENKVTINGDDSNINNNHITNTATYNVDSAIILGIGRVLSGVLHSKDIEYYCFGPKYDPKRDSESPLCKKAIRLYILMGSSYVRVQSVPAGHFCAIHGLEELQLKTVTLCSSPHAMPLVVADGGIRPLVKVNVEAKSALDTETLERGLAKLSLADPAVEVTATSKGERILACLGELHLEQSILDLKNIYCDKKIELRISEQIVHFGESTTWFDNETLDFEQFYKLQSPPLRQTLIPPYCYEDGLGHSWNGRSRVVISNKAMALHVRVIPLPKRVHDLMMKKTIIDDESEQNLILLSKALNLKTDGNSNDTLEKLLSLLISIDTRGNAMIKGPTIVKKGVVSPSDEVYLPPTLIPKSEKNKNTIDESNEKDPNGNALNAIPSYGKDVYDEIKQCISKNQSTNCTEDIDKSVSKIWSELEGSCTAGFQAGCAAGPLCEESVRGILVILEGLEIAIRRKTSGIAIAGSENNYCLAKPVSGGMIVASLKTGIRSALLTRPARLVEGYLRLTLHSSLTGLGPLYAILSRRRGSVISDTMVEGTDLISIDAQLPQSESFGLVSELLQKSSGEVTAPELVFSHWEILDEDPFWIPTSLEEREDYGEIVLNGDSSTGVDNTALKYIRMVRDRKGLIVDSNKIIVAAEKQRTLARKK